MVFIPPDRSWDLTPSRPIRNDWIGWCLKDTRDHPFNYLGGYDMDLDLLSGQWRAVRIEKAGSTVPEELAAIVRYIFEGERVTLMEGDQPAGQGVIRLD